MLAARRLTEAGLQPCGFVEHSRPPIHCMKVGWRACCVSMQLDSKGAPRAGFFDLVSCPMQDHTQLSESMFDTVVRQLRFQQREMELVRSSAEQVTQKCLLTPFVKEIVSRPRS